MNGQAGIDLIQARFGNRTGINEAWILLEMQNAQKRLELNPELPWFLDTKSTLTTVASTQTVATPTGFLRELDNGLFGVDSQGNVVEIKKASYRMLRTNNATFATNKFPENYDLINGTLYFFPTPDAAYSLEFWSSIAGTTITVSNETHWMLYAPELLIAEAMIPIAQFLRDEGMIAMAMQRAKGEMARLDTATVAYREANHSRYNNEAM